MSLESRQQNVALAGTAVQAICLASGYDPQTASMLQLALEESITNAIKYAYQDQPGKEVEVTISILPDRLTFEVGDQGTGLKSWPGPGPNGTVNPPPVLQEGGRGIFLINHTMDEVSYRSEGGRNFLTMSKTRPTV